MPVTPLGAKDAGAPKAHSAGITPFSLSRSWCFSARAGFFLNVTALTEARPTGTASLEDARRDTACLILPQGLRHSSASFRKAEG